MANEWDHDMSGFPSDWPGPGLIDLAFHDLPHQSSATEWWYMNGHFMIADGRMLSIFATFFRIAHGKNEVTKEVEHAHSVVWALSDATSKVYHMESRLDKRAPGIGLERIRRGLGSKDPRLNRAIAEVLERERLPGPDRMFEGNVFVGERRLELDFSGARLDKQDDGSYRISLFNQRAQTGCNIDFHPEKPPVRHGDDGVAKGTMCEDMFYYILPRCRLTGSVIINGIEQPIVSGAGWYDHEFGGYFSVAPGGESSEGSEPAHNTAWNWTAIQLDDGNEITAYSIIRSDTQKVIGQWLIVIDPDGHCSNYPDMTLEPVRWWRSTRSFLNYPTSWRLHAPKAKIDLTIEASFEDQEFITVVSGNGFWEGRCDVIGTMGGRRVKGLAFFERRGFEAFSDLDGFFSAVGEEVRKSVERIIPIEPTLGQLRNLIASDDRKHYMVGVDIPRLARSLIKPMREITDRGGKSWRSYAALVCCDVVGGDSRKFVQWLAMPELIHVGSLIVDDIEDRSTVRRGGPACHLIYGEPIAINAGNAAYFMGQKLLVSNELSDTQKLLLYDLYFEALRAAHAGQAMDITGMDDLMPGVVESGDSSALEQRLLAVHRLKTGVPAASLARMGAIAGGGTKDQVEALGQYYESIGIAFQIIDDVLNLRGFKGDLKVRGEDIAKGKITLPVAKAMSILPIAERKWIWDIFQSKPEDRQVVSSIVEKLEACGALDASVEQARDLVETAWKSLDPKFEESLSKIMLRTFGWYILERHY
jgi:geranylgeranyl pyrophosphate synthase/predicted secreted hydrolase